MASIQESSSGDRRRWKRASWRRKKWLLLLGALTFVSGAVQLGLKVKHARKMRSRDPRTVEPRCQNQARKLREPYVDGYLSREQNIDLQGPQYAFHSWTDAISRSDFERTLDTNSSTLTFKVVDNVLYAKAHWNRTDLPGFVTPRRDALVFQLLLTLHLYSVPDVEMTFYMEDVPVCGLPFAAYNVDGRCGTKAGFTIPSYDVFKSAYGPRQIDRYLSCLDRAFPLEKGRRIPKAVWRGSSTGTPLVVSRTSLPQFERFRLVSLGERRPDIFDVGFTTYVQLDEGDPDILEIMREVAPLKRFLPIDDFNNYAVVLDLDGNAWSDRFSKLLFYNTPILKQESPWKDYFAHLVEPLMSSSTFQRNLSDLVPKTEEILRSYRDASGMEQIRRQANDRRAFAREHFSQLGVARATAYTLTVYGRKQSWKVTLDGDDTRVVPDLRHPYCDRFPKELIEDAFGDFVLQAQD